MEINYETELKKIAEPSYKKWIQPLVPTIHPDHILGVRVGNIRQLAKQTKNSTSAKTFLLQVPHTYLEANYLHVFLVQNLAQLEEFLPYIDNWAVCDSCPIFDEMTDGKLMEWLQSDHPYTIRYALVCLMKTSRFSSFWIEKIVRIQSCEYYVNMAIAWYLSMALVHEYSTTLPYFLSRSMSDWIFKKAIQKALESKQIDDEKKQELRRLKGGKL